MRQALSDARYELIADFVSAMTGGCDNPANKSLWEQWGFTESWDSDWNGADCRTGNDVQKRMRDGWPEGRDRLNELRSGVTTLDALPQDRRRRMVRGPSGDTLDINAVYAGRLDVAWRTPRRTTSSGPQKIELCANMLCSGGAHADVLFWRGAAAAVLADLLEFAGYMVRLVVIFGGEVCGGSGEKVSCRVTVKEHGTPFDVTSTSATILPGFFRSPDMLGSRHIVKAK